MKCEKCKRELCGNTERWIDPTLARVHSLDCENAELRLRLDGVLEEVSAYLFSLSADYPLGSRTSEALMIAAADVARGEVSISARCGTLDKFLDKAKRIEKMR